MSNDQIIRSSKRHEVSIPEGSNNASSQKALIGVHEPEPGSESSLTAAHEQPDQRVTLTQETAEDAQRLLLAQEEAPASSRVQLPSEASILDNRIQLAPDDSTLDNRVQLPDEHASETNRVRLPQEGGPASERVPVPGDDFLASERVKLPSGQALHDNTVVMTADIREDNVVKLASSTATEHVEHLEQKGLQDTHAGLPDMTNSPDATDSLDAECAAAPSRAVVDEGHDRPIVSVPPAELEEDADVAVLEALVEDEQQSPAVAESLIAQAHDQPDEPPMAHEQAPLAQVSGYLSDKKTEEFRGRVVKLREEVDQLNRRLDEIEKHEIEKQY